MNDTLAQAIYAARAKGQPGFMTESGVFLGRAGAKAAVKATSQPTIRDTHATELFSEDLW